MPELNGLLIAIPIVLVFALMSLPWGREKRSVVKVPRMKRRWFRERQHLESRIEFEGPSSGNRPWGDAA